MVESSPLRAFASGETKREVVVAVIDSGVDYNHKDLAPFMWKNPREIPDNGIDDDHNGYVDDVYGWDFVNNDHDPMADDSELYHGTHVAGIVQQASELAQAGTSVKIMALKYLDSNALGRTSDAIKAIDYAVENGAQVLSNSWGSWSYSPALSEAIDRARSHGVLFIAAAGNGDASGNGVNTDQIPFYPAAYSQDNIVSVAAVSDQNLLAPWSNFGFLTVDVSALGVHVLSTRNGNSYATLSGTSMATPLVAGVAALVWTLRPELDFSQIRQLLFQSGSVSSDLVGRLSYPIRVTPSAAIEKARSFIPGPPPAPPSSEKLISKQCSP
jgi:subtilisin family serine protease